MPAHGRPVFLAEAIGSVLAQTHRELVLFVLDDSQDDAIERVVRPFLADGRVQYRRSEPVTAGGAMTALIQAGDSPYFAFLHDDDRWEPGFLERRVRFMEAHPECGLVFSGHVDIDAEGRETTRASVPFPEGVVPKNQLVPQMLERNVIDTMHSVLVRRDALQAAGAWLDERFPRLFDWELWLRLVLRFPAGCVGGEDAHYRAHEAQMSGSAGRAEDFKQLVAHADRLCVELAPELRPAERIRRRQLARLELSGAMDLLRHDDVRAATEAIRAALRADRRTVLLDRRLPVVLLGLVAGRPGRRAGAALRAEVYRRSRRRRMAGR